MARIWTNGSGLALNATDLNAMEADIAVGLDGGNASGGKGSKIRRDTAANWTSSNPVLAQGEEGLETDTGNLKIGDGATAWNLLGYAFALASAPNIQGLPGSPKSGNVRQGSVSATVSGSAHNAFPGVALCRDGTILTVWRSGANHSPSVGVIKARKYKTNLSAVAAEYTILTDATYDLRDPMLTALPDGRIVIQYFKYDTVNLVGVGVYVAISVDNGATFSTPVKVPFTWTAETASSSRVVIAPNGDWLAPAYGRTSATFYQIRLMRSQDGGKTWTGEITVASGQASSQNFTEPVIGVLPDGVTLMALIRVANSDGTSPAIYSCTSTDNGNTWTTAASVIAGENARPAWRSLASGGVVVATRSATAPSPMQYFTSWDSGNTWTTALQLGPTPGSQGTYAQLIEVAPGLILAAYAIEASSTASTVYLAYLADGFGYSPAEDDFTDPEGIIVKWAGEGGAVGGAAAVSSVLGWPVLTLTKSSGDQCAFAFKVPASWRTFNIDVLWTNNVGGTAGNIYFRYDYEQVDVNGTLTSNAGVSAAVATAGQFILVATQMAANVARTNAFLRVKPTRLGTNANDTYASSIAVVGVRLTRTS